MTDDLDDLVVQWLSDEKNDKEDIDACRKALVVHAPSAGTQDIESSLECFFPTTGSSLILKKAKKPPWYVKPSAGSLNFTTYYNSSLHLPKPAKEIINKSSLELINLLPDPSKPFEPVSGLVVGNVQSGKTANFTALVARAADSGYNLIVILSGGNYNDLRAQTQLRLFKDLIDPVNLKKDVWHKATNVNSINLRGDVGNDSDGWNKHWNPKTHPHCLVVTKKNAKTLPKLKNWILDIKKKYDHPIKLLLIDDEADHASLNRMIKKRKLTEEEKKEADDASAINRSIREILQEVKQNAYIGFTASPFANLFVPPDYDEMEYGSNKVPTLYPRDFIYLLPEPIGYFGLSKLCPGDEWEWTDVLCKVSEPEAKFYREHTEKLPVSASLHPGLKASIFDFFVSLGIKFIRRKAKHTAKPSISPHNFHHSMLIHTKHTKNTMRGITLTIAPFIEAVRGAVNESASPVQTQDVKDLLSSFEKQYDQSKTKINSPPSWDDFLENLREYLSHPSTATFPDVKEISSDKDSGENLVYIDDQPCAVIAVGGNRLARGFTLEGLSVSYFIREPSSGFKSDTLLQQGRWYGFRGQDEDLVRVYTTESICKELWELKRVEQGCHQKIREFAEQDLPPSAYAVAVIKTANQSPTSKDKIPFLRSKKVPSLFSGDYLPKNGSSFPIRKGDSDSESKLLDNFKQLGTFLDDCNKRAGGLPVCVEHRYTWLGVPLTDVRAYLDSTLDNFYNDCYEKEALLKYLDARAGMSYGDCSTWTVVLVGRTPEAKYPVQSVSLGADTYNICLVKRSRTEKSSNAVGYFTQLKHFSIGLPVHSASIQENCRKRPNTNPILLLYLFDKDFKATDSKRGDLDTIQHVVVPVIGFPKATKLTSEERENLNITIWENGKLISTYVKE